MTISSGGQGRKPTIGRAKNGDNVHQRKREPSGRPDDLGRLDIVGFIVSRLPSFEDPSKNHLLVLPDSLHGRQWSVAGSNLMCLIR
jgi:hypothetical protein